MPSLNVAVLGEDPAERVDCAHQFGKKGSTDDMSFYHTVFQGKIVTAVEPTAYPAKLATLTQAISLCDHALVIAGKPSPALGETIVALDMLGGFTEVVFAGPIDLTALLAGTSLAGSKSFDTAGEAREYLLTKESRGADGSTKVFVDHCFEVKGVGTVALGIVKRGAVKVHDRYTAFPGARHVEVKSIQMNDEDVESAPVGARVGLSLKNARADEIPRGTVFSATNLSEGTELDCELALSKFCKMPLADGAVVHVAAGLQFEPARIKCAVEIKPGSIGAAKLVCEKPLAFEAGEKLLVCDLNAKGLRVIGSALPKA